MENKSRHLLYIDALKGLGCLCVFFCHYRMWGFLSPIETYCNNPLANLLFYGDLYVCIFLIASSYGISCSFNSNKSSNIGISKMLFKRYFRLAIPIGLLLIIFGLIHYLGFQYNENAAKILNNECLKNEMENLSLKGLIQAIFLSPFSIQHRWLPQVWMISYILYGTFLTVALDFITSMMSFKKAMIYCAFCIILFKFVNPYFINIIVGYILYRLNQNKRTMKDNKWKASVCLLMFVIIYLLCYYKRINTTGFVSTILAGFFIFFIQFSNMIQNLLSNKMLIKLGGVSFALYIIHFMVVTRWRN